MDDFYFDIGLCTECTNPPPGDGYCNNEATWLLVYSDLLVAGKCSACAARYASTGTWKKKIPLHEATLREAVSAISQAKSLGRYIGPPPINGLPPLEAEALADALEEEVGRAYARAARKGHQQPDASRVIAKIAKLRETARIGRLQERRKEPGHG